MIDAGCELIAVMTRGSDRRFSRVGENLSRINLVQLWNTRNTPACVDFGAYALFAFPPEKGSEDMDVSRTVGLSSWLRRRTLFSHLAGVSLLGVVIGASGCQSSKLFSKADDASSTRRGVD
ncbi:MAG: hypothetical protein R3B90_21325 [Planctomycetaceae bacterium]